MSAMVSQITGVASPFDNVIIDYAMTWAADGSSMAQIPPCMTTVLNELEITDVDLRSNLHRTMNNVF